MKPTKLIDTLRCSTLIMISRHVVTVVTALRLIGFIDTACALELSLPSPVESALYNLTFEDPSEGELLDISSLEVNTSSTISPPTNLSLPLHVPNDNDYQCAPGYGTPLPAACRSVYTDMPDFDSINTWGDRRNYVQPEIRLPFRMSSCESPNRFLQ